MSLGQSVRPVFKHFFPFFVGAKVGEKISKKPSLPYILGYASTIASQAFWEIFIDPRMKYSCLTFKETAKDSMAAIAGASLAAGIYFYSKNKDQVDLVYKIAKDYLKDYFS